MELTHGALGDTPMLVVRGALDRSSCSALQTGLEKLFAGGHNLVFLDFSEVPFIDSGGLSVIRTAAETLKRGWLGVIGLNADVRRLLETEGLLSHPSIRVFENRQAARVATGERAST